MSTPEMSPPLSPVVEEMVFLPALPLLALGPLSPLVVVAAAALRSLGEGRCSEGGRDLRCAGGRDSSLAPLAPSAIAIVRVEVSENNHVGMGSAAATTPSSPQLLGLRHASRLAVQRDATQGRAYEVMMKQQEYIIFALQHTSILASSNPPSRPPSLNTSHHD